MSWWDTSQFTSIASNAIKNAQKKIDKVLDIPTEDEDGNSSKPKQEEKKSANSSWSAWGSPSSFLPSTPKSSTFSEPSGRSSFLPSTPKSSTSSEPSEQLATVPTLSSSSPTPTSLESSNSNADPPQEDCQEHAVVDSLEPCALEAVSLESGILEPVAILKDEPIAASSPAIVEDKRLEKRQARRQRSREKPPTTKKLGAVKLGAVKIKKLEPEEAQSSEPPEPVKLTSDNEGSMFPHSDAHELAASSTIEYAPINTDTVIDLQSKTNQIQDTITSSSNSVSDYKTDFTEQTLEASTTDLGVPVLDAQTEQDRSDLEPKLDQSAQWSEWPPKAAESNSEMTENLLTDSPGGDPAPLNNQAVQSQPVTSNDGLSLASVSEMTSGESVAASAFADASVDNAASSESMDENATSAITAPDNPLSGNDAPSERDFPPRAEHSSQVTDPSSELLLRSVGSDLLLVGSEVGVSDEDKLKAAADERSQSIDDSSVAWSEADQPGQSKDTLVPAEVSELIIKSGSSDGTVIDQITEPLVKNEEDKVVEELENRLGNEMVTSMTPSSLMDQSTCSDNSYVKCELPASNDSSNDYQRGAPSEFSDFETGTSSDIEIISMASTYGDGNGDARMLDFVPLSRSVFKTKLREISPEDEISLSSSQISPSSDDDPVTVNSAKSNKSTANEESSSGDIDNPLDAKTLLKKLSQLSEVLEARETKLLSMSREHSELLEVNAHLKRRIEQMEETNGDLDLVKGEFGQRLHELERKLQNSLREKELVKKQLMTTQEELHNRAGTSGKMQRMVEDKDEQISSLMAEGEKLAKQQLQSNNLIKKLRKKEKEQEELSRAQREKIDSQNAELERLKSVLDSKIQNETKHSELIKQLNGAVSTYQTENQKLKCDAEEGLEKQKRAESAVDNSYKEIAELHKTVASKDTRIKELMADNEAHMKEELQLALNKKQKEALRDADHFTNQIDDMQLSMTRMDKEHQRREDCLRQEKQDLLEKLENSDKRNDELTHTVSAATKPLLRQIENLQSSYSAQSSSWEKLEKNLTDRLTEAQNQLASATEKERLSNENIMELSSRINTLETQLSSLKQEKSKLTAELEMCKIKISTLQDERNSSIAQLDTYQTNNESDKMETKKMFTLLENKLELEKARTESEKKKYLAVMEQLNDKDQQIHELTISRVRNTPSPLSVNEEGKSGQGMRRSMKQDELLERALSNSSIMGSSLYENMRNHSTTSLLESLESQVKQREGEITQLQADILEHEKTRESLTKEMIKLTEENGAQENRIKQLTKVQQQHKELNGRYQALLQMYGEKEEEVTELRMDLMDVKQMYKQQIDALLSK